MSFATETNSKSHGLGQSTSQSRINYVLAYTVGQAKYPLVTCEDYVTFATLADPASRVINAMGGGSCCTMKRRMEDNGNYLVEKELIALLQSFPFIGIQINNSLDAATRIMFGVHQCTKHGSSVCWHSHYFCHTIPGSPKAEKTLLVLTKCAYSHGGPNNQNIPFHLRWGSSDAWAKMKKQWCSMYEGCWNALIFIQHGMVHKEILCSKDMPSKWSRALWRS